MEIDATEGGEKRTKHHHGENGIDDRPQGVTRSIELGHPIEGEIDERARHNGAGQRPVLQKFLNSHVAKIILIYDLRFTIYDFFFGRSNFFTFHYSLFTSFLYLCRQL